MTRLGAFSVGITFLQACLFAGVGGDGERAAMAYRAGDRHFVMQKAPFHAGQLQPGIAAEEDSMGWLEPGKGQT